MSKYKIRVSFDEKNFFWVVIDRENFIRMGGTKNIE